MTIPAKVARALGGEDQGLFAVLVAIDGGEFFEGFALDFVAIGNLCGEFGWVDQGQIHLNDLVSKSVRPLPTSPPHDPHPVQQRRPSKGNSFQTLQLVPTGPTQSNSGREADAT